MRCPTGVGTSYLTVVVDHDTRRLLWIAEGRDSTVLGRVLRTPRPAERAPRSPWSPLTARNGSSPPCRNCPRARICLDPFHVVVWAGKALDAVRPRGLTPPPAKPDRKPPPPGHQRRQIRPVEERRRPHRPPTERSSPTSNRPTNPCSAPTSSTSNSGRSSPPRRRRTHRPPRRLARLGHHQRPDPVRRPRLPHPPLLARGHHQHPHLPPDPTASSNPPTPKSGS